jgi:sigma-B regulation protein RsbU (phosphoserine phosphatase)
MPHHYSTAPAVVARKGSESVASSSRTVRATLYLAPAREAPSMARHVLAAAGSAAGLTDDQTEALALCASEAVTNAVVHAGTSVRVDLLVNDVGARVLVHDDEPADAELTRRTVQRPVAAPREPLAIGGRGLAMIDSLATTWGVEPNLPGKTVWFVVGTSPDD